MFILRKLFWEADSKFATESNQILGDSYNTVTEHNKDYETLMEGWEVFKEEIYAFIVCKDGSEVIPLYKKQGNYIMTSDGKTFSNLTRHIDKR